MYEHSTVTNATQTVKIEAEIKRKLNFAIAEPVELSSGQFVEYIEDGNQSKQFIVNKSNDNHEENERKNRFLVSKFLDRVGLS